MEQITELGRKPVVVGIGELLWDMLPSGKRAGGAPTNSVYHVSCLGAEGYATSAIGDNELGEEVVDELDKNYIQHLIEKVPYPTGTIQVELREGILTCTIHKRVAWDHISPTSDATDLAEKADVICFGILAQRSRQSRETIQAISSFAPKDTYRLLDINLRQRYHDKELVEEFLYLANVLEMSDEESNVLRDSFGSNGTEREVALWSIKKYSFRVFVLIAENSHSTIYTREEIPTLPTPEVMVTGTAGAGDAFSGVLIISLLRGKSLSEAHHFAIKTVALVCTEEDARLVYEE